MYIFSHTLTRHDKHTIYERAHSPQQHYYMAAVAWAIAAAAAMIFDRLFFLAVVFHLPAERNEPDEE